MVSPGAARGYLLRAHCSRMDDSFAAGGDGSAQRVFARMRRCQMITVNFGVSGPKFTKFFCDVDRTSGVLMCPFALPPCHPLWNVSPNFPRRKACRRFRPILADLAPKIGCYGNVPWAIAKRIPNWTSSPSVYQPWKFGEGRPGRFCYLFAPFKKRRKERK